MDRSSRWAPLAVAAVLVAGCGDGGTDDAAPAPTTPPAATTAPPPTATSQPTPTPSPTTAAADWPTCTSTRAPLRVSYPPGWTARDIPDGGCAYFDPEPFDVEPATEAPSVAVTLDVESVPYERVRSGFQEDVSSEQQTTVAGYPAVRIENRDTQGPFGPRGRQLTYVADLGGDQTLVLTTSEADAEDFAGAQQVVDEMAQRLEHTG